jgi:2-oxoisovalerate dehydrogenase E1 component
MSVRRESAVEQQLKRCIAEHPGPDPTAQLPLPRADVVALFETMLQTRLQDLESRRLKDAGTGYYTIGSSGHEGNAVFGRLLRVDDPAFLHYRSGAFLIARARLARGETPLFDTMLSFVASAEDPISGGRHKVLGSRSLWIPPQTSTIASHVPKAVGFALAIARLQRLDLPARVPHDAIVYCSFGDASVNHATAQSGFNAAAAATMHRQPCPILFVCEDNGFGISVRTPHDYVERMFRTRPGFDWFAADSRDLGQTWRVAQAAIAHCRATRRPVFFHLRTVRLMGHAGTDLEAGYLTAEEIAANEARDPLLCVADLLLRCGALTKEQVQELYADLEARVRRAGVEAGRRRKLASAAEVTAPLALPAAAALVARPAAAELRRRAFGEQLPELDARPRHLAFRIAQALKDLMCSYPQMLVFGEDVARKGGVYWATEGLYATFGGGRVFNTILDETSILGLAQGFAQAGCLPFPEIQYLAYLHNAIDQIRGEAASLQFFSQRQYQNPMVVRIAGLGYQKGFGGHFHNDNSLGALLEIPGLILAVPSRGDDAVTMLRTCAAAAEQHGSVCVFVEPIALYMTKDLHEKNDGRWQFPYPAPGELCPLGRARAYVEPDDRDLLLVTYGNGAHMCLQARAALRRRGVRARVLDLRWLLPLPLADIKEHAREVPAVLVVDECRRSGGGPSASIVAELAQDPEFAGRRLRRLCGEDTYIPLGPAANLVMVQTEDIVREAQELVRR